MIESLLHLVEAVPPPDHEIDDWYGLAAIFLWAMVTIVSSVVAAWATLRSRKDVRETRKNTVEVKDQVVNGHAEAPPLRKDLDTVLRKLDGLHDGLVAERAAREESVSRLHERFDALMEREVFNLRRIQIPFTGIGRRKDDPPDD